MKSYAGSVASGLVTCKLLLENSLRKGLNSSNTDTTRA